MTKIAKDPELIAMFAFACAVLFCPGVQAAETDATNLVVKLGFDQFPVENTYDGADVSPAIGVQGLIASSLAIIVDDMDAPPGTFTHWVIWNIPPTDVIPGRIAKSGTIADPFPARQGTNDFGEIGYAGPCPPSGKPHRYFFRAYGLDEMLDLPAGATATDLRAAIEGHVLQKGEALASYGA